MKFSEFKITNFKGIDSLTLNLEKSPEANIFTLVGLNESGKTTILEAIDLFSPLNKELKALEIPGSVIKDPNSMIPISKRDNFNDRVSLAFKLSVDEDDLRKINDYAKEHTEFKKVSPKRDRNYLTYFRHYNFENSKFKDLDSKWSGFEGVLKNGYKTVDIGDISYNHVNTKLATFCRSLIPSILYFPNFLFDFPSRIYLETKENPSPKQQFYIELIQDILYSLDNSTNIKTHLVERIKNKERQSLNRLVQKMAVKVTDVVFEAWSRIFKQQVSATRIVINYASDDEDLAYLEIDIEADDGIYSINERSLGFRWFFIFLLFTQFRPFRKDTPQNVIFLFDEPASNLHPNAQKQLLKSFENLTLNSKIIYATHSHHLINPNWLESTFIVRNEALKFDATDSYNVKQTNISIKTYREFAAAHPHNTAYFQPILDVLDYRPSDLENISNAVFLEGKTDFYVLKYLKEVILKIPGDIALVPSTGSSNLNTLISLYMGWGKEFIILLDSDKEGKSQKTKYIDSFGIIVEQRIFTLDDIDAFWKKHGIEKLFDPSELLLIQQKSFPDTTRYDKTNFHRTIQELLINKIEVPLSVQTMNNFRRLISFLTEKVRDGN
ncbi:putative ATP-dependent endonuclease of OLD family [Chitinophaga polysaccharea]|uniref:Putative ATP-dependent endonuclease of OLD family n=1 Tax=Chitinophaga polysaccharea TaxID=1293035 RepID=A0A561PNA7_9BACT|nr:AAA family ATPase [Chitinophaga polysaccharea]TWF39601.1 putative ATP-dependent endonuclease of OLD family [Chitinophaga polysaccharea]